MQRRLFLAGGVTFAGGVALTASGPVPAAADGHVPYTRDAFERALAGGGPLLLDFYAPW